MPKLLLLLLLLPLSFALMEETEVDPLNRVCNPDEVKSAQSCKSQVTLLSETFNNIQSDHQNLGAQDHISMNHNCKTTMKCLKNYNGCEDITSDLVDEMRKKCEYMNYLTGAFFPCSQKLKEVKETSKCVGNFFREDGIPNTKEEDCEDWQSNRACLKWTIRDKCNRNFWAQYRYFWRLRYDILKCSSN